MRLNKKQICSILAAAVSVCFVVCLVSTLQAWLAATRTGGAFPAGMLMLTIVTFLCTVMIWHGVRDMK